MKWLTELLSKIFRNGVSKDVCVEIQKTNIQAHEHLEDCIEGAVQLCSERFQDLKEDMHRGFDEVKELIKAK